MVLIKTKLWVLKLNLNIYCKPIGIHVNARVLQADNNGWQPVYYHSFRKVKHVQNSNAEIKMSYWMQKVHESTLNSMVAFPWFLATSRAAVADASALNASVIDGQKSHCTDDNTATWTHYWSTEDHKNVAHQLSLVNYLV